MTIRKKRLGKVDGDRRFGVADLNGEKFGRLKVIGYAGRDKLVRPMWICECDCGTKGIVVLHYHLTYGKKSSCGCLRRENTRMLKLSHGCKGSAENRSWISMKNRCNNKRATGYRYYGGRGIKVCERWMNSFSNFLADMGKRPDGMTLGRIDNNGNYEPSNCRWESQEEQISNTRHNRFLEFEGARMTMSRWASRVGLKYDTLRQRLDSGWSVEKSLTTPLTRKRRAI